MIYEEMRKRTYVVEHNPNCPRPFLVRLVGFAKAHIDHLPPRQTTDILGYGDTFEEAARVALDKKNAKKLEWNAGLEARRVQRQTSPI